ncbi:signal transduction histidine kinase [Catenuloplanes nepalensis]|uniref:histidine kinase n=1 Tax=Catenuloplanes nepalensis TaxID=587533 RepID=A0ABT9MLH6_9ACTN|nr:histidine kinase [Catenuloplanes nepalensis]MDP9792253.1 signal transduction histidine kinase [Catenuloplanes nepalensis]
MRRLAADRLDEVREREQRRERLRRERDLRMHREMIARLRERQQRRHHHWGRPPWHDHRLPPWADPDRKKPDSLGGIVIFTALVQVIGVRLVAGSWDAFSPLMVALLLAGPISLLFRKVIPVLPVAVAAGAAIAYTLAGFPGGPFFVALIVAVVHGVRAGRAIRVAAVVGVAWLCYLLAGRILADLLGVPSDNRPTFAALAIIALTSIVTVVGTEAGRTREIQIAEMMRAEAEEARAREEQDKRQASEERLSIARELHDVIGHHLSLINVQAGVGLHLMDSRPEQARSALAAIKTASSEALREVRAVLGALAEEDESAPRAPAPGLARLDALTGGAGLPCRTVVRGTPRPLPAEVDRAAYRIVQEALTNVRRHAGGAATTVTVGYAPDGVGLRVENEPGEADPTVPPGSGIGLPGMRARAEALGGSLEAAPTASGGYLVVAHLPAPEGEKK